jgi:hypothetical protein
MVGRRLVRISALSRQGALDRIMLTYTDVCVDRIMLTYTDVCVLMRSGHAVWPVGYGSHAFEFSIKIISYPPTLRSLALSLFSLSALSGAYFSSRTLLSRASLPLSKTQPSHTQRRLRTNGRGMPWHDSVLRVETRNL